KLLNMQFIGGGPSNVPPVAAFTYNCTGLTCTFTSTSTDSDGTITGYAWKVPNGNTVSTASSFSRTFNGPTTVNLTLTVTDNGGASTSITQQAVATGGGSNVPPVASFTYSCVAATHTCTFTSTSTDSDGTIASYAWKTPNGTTVATTSSFTKAFPSARTLNLSLTVTDNGGASHTVTQS